MNGKSSVISFQYLVTSHQQLIESDHNFSYPLNMTMHGLALIGILIENWLS